MVWLDSNDFEAALACFEEACAVDGANASTHFYKTVALVKVCSPGPLGTTSNLDLSSPPCIF